MLLNAAGCCCWMLLNVTIRRCCWMLLDGVGCNSHIQEMLLDVAGCCWMLLDAAGCWWLLLAVAGCRWMSLDVAGCCWMLLDVTHNLQECLCAMIPFVHSLSHKSCSCRLPICPGPIVSKVWWWVQYSRALYLSRSYLWPQLLWNP